MVTSNVTTSVVLVIDVFFTSHVVCLKKNNNTNNSGCSYIELEGFQQIGSFIVVCEQLIVCVQ